MQRVTRMTCALTLIAVSACGTVFGEGGNKAVFAFSPMVGVIESEVQFHMPASGMTKSLKENGGLQGINLVYAAPGLAIGSLMHNSHLSSSREDGYLLYGNYYFRSTEKIQPMAGFYGEYVGIVTQMSGRDAAPLNAVNVTNTVTTLHPVVGLSYVGSNYRVTPFAGYFNEQVETTVSSPGMTIAGQVRNGFSADSPTVLDYATLGSKFEVTMFRFVRLDTKFYYRMKQGSSPLFTTRNRIDVFLTKAVGVSMKLDYFQDAFENNMFAFIGPTFIF